MKALLTILFSLCFLLVVSQTPVPYKTPYTKIGALNSAVSDTGGLFVRETFTPPSYPDTITANGTRARLYPGSEITVGNTKYFRSSDATRWITFGTAACPGTQLISGSITWSGSGLVFDATNLAYYIICGYYTSSATTLTLTTADPTFDRIDKLYADITGNVGVITGVPSSNPQEPQVNPLTQISLGFVYVGAGSTTPTGQTATTIYNENVEWTGASNVAGINFAYATNPYEGTVSTLVPNAVSNQFVSWQNGSLLNISDYEYLKFYIRLNTPVLSDEISLLTVSFYNGATKVSQDVLIPNGSFGLNTSTLNSYQLIVIPLSGITVTPPDFDKVNFVVNGALSNFQLDKVYLLSGAVVPPVISDAWQIQGNAGTNPDRDFLGTTDNVKLNLATKGKVRLSIPSDGINENQDTALKILVTDLDDPQRATYWISQPTIYALGCIKIYDSTSVDGTRKYIRDTCSGGGGSGWQLTGNGISSGDFLGTNNDEDLVFKRNNLGAGRISSSNVSFGVGSMGLNTFGALNTSVGTQTLAANTTGSYNTAIGVFNLASNTTGDYNTAIGQYSLINNITGEKNTGVGQGSLNISQSDVGNTGVGFQALDSVNGGNYNTAIGYHANVAVSSRLTRQSIAIGYMARASSNQMAISDSIKEIKAAGIPTGAGYVLTDVAGNGVMTLQPAGGTTPDLQAVTNVGASTTNSIDVFGSDKYINVSSLISSGNALILVDEVSGGTLSLADPAGFSTSMTANADGNLQLTTGLALGSYIQYSKQTTQPATPGAGGVRAYFDSLSRFSYVNGSGYRRTYSMPYPGNQLWYFPYKVNGGTLVDSAINAAALANKVTVGTTGVINGVSYNGNEKVAVGMRMIANQKMGMAMVCEPIDGSLMDATGFVAAISARMYLTRFMVQKDTTITGIGWKSVVAASMTASNENRIGIYSCNTSTGLLTLVASTTNDGTMWNATANTIGTKALTTPFAAVTGTVYYFAFLASWSAGTGPTWGSIGGATGLSTVYNFPNSIRPYGLLSSQTTLPTTIASSSLTSTYQPMYGFGY